MRNITHFSFEGSDVVQLTYQEADNLRKIQNSLSQATGDHIFQGVYQSITDATSQGRTLTKDERVALASMLFDRVKTLTSGYAALKTKFNAEGNIFFERSVDTTLPESMSDGYQDGIPVFDPKGKNGQKVMDFIDSLQNDSGENKYTGIYCIGCCQLFKALLDDRPDPLQLTDAQKRDFTRNFLSTDTVLQGHSHSDNIQDTSFSMNSDSQDFANLIFNQMIKRGIEIPGKEIIEDPDKFKQFIKDHSTFEDITGVLKESFNFTNTQIKQLASDFIITHKTDVEMQQQIQASLDNLDRSKKDQFVVDFTRTRCIFHSEEGGEINSYSLDFKNLLATELLKRGVVFPENVLISPQASPEEQQTQSHEFINFVNSKITFEDITNVLKQSFHFTDKQVHSFISAMDQQSLLVIPFEMHTLCKTDNVASVPATRLGEKRSIVRINYSNNHGLKDISYSGVATDYGPIEEEQVIDYERKYKARCEYEMGKGEYTATCPIGETTLVLSFDRPSQKELEARDMPYRGNCIPAIQDNCQLSLEYKAINPERGRIPTPRSLIDNGAIHEIRLRSKTTAASLMTPAGSSCRTSAHITPTNLGKRNPDITVG